MSEQEDRNDMVRHTHTDANGDAVVEEYELTDEEQAVRDREALILRFLDINRPTLEQVTAVLKVIIQARV